MARRQDSGSNSAHENERPNPHNEDTVPENTEPIARRDEEFEEFEEIDLDEEDELTDEDDDESSY